jgi:hypothetical protein
MTLCQGDHLVIKRGGEIVSGEAYHEFEVLEVQYEPEPGKVIYAAKLLVLE